MFLVGLTGGIASGKSTVAQMFVALGCPLVDADVIAREVVEPGKPAWRKIKDKFGSDVINSDDTLNREKLGQVIFNDPQRRRLLNSITHPEIYKVMMWSVFSYFLRGHQFVILDLPLLFESGATVKYLHDIIVVNCDEDVQLQRLVTRNELSEEDARQRISSQLPLSEKCKRATHIIDNNSDAGHTKKQVLKIYEALRRSRSHWKARILLLASAGLLVYGTSFILRSVGVL